MLKDLIRMWKKIDLLKESFEQFLSMIDMVEQMFRCSTDALFGARKCANARGTLFKTDISVNKTERHIRKNLVEHLAVNPRADAPACLILMSASKDVERAGDYCKNLLEVADMLKTPAMETAYGEDLREMADLVTAGFAKTRTAFAEENHTVAHNVIVEETQIAKRSDAMVEKVANDESLDANQAVCLALAFRFLKRVNAHLGNVASSVVMPLHKIDYFDEKWKRDHNEDAVERRLPQADNDPADGDENTEGEEE
ncbi:MAG: PhoU domain-containing protein [Planctomycetota bacterium]